MGTARARVWAFGTATAVVAIFGLVTALGADAATGQLTPQGCVKDTGSGASCAAENQGLAAAESVATSPDGRSVYATGFNDDAVAILNRDTTTGALTPAGCISDTSNPICGAGNVNDGLRDARGVAVSPDGLDVYVASELDQAVAVLHRNPSTGALTPGGCVPNTGDVAGCGVAAQGGLSGAQNVVVDPDGMAVYVAGNEAVVRLTRNPADGSLSPSGCVMNPGASSGCATTQAGLSNPHDIAISADGESLYVASVGSVGGGAVVGLAAPSLGPLGCVSDTDDPVGGCPTTQGVDDSRGVAISQDGTSVYSVSGSDAAIVRFDRGAGGGLTPAGCISDVGTATCPTQQQGLNLGRDVAVSPDNASVYSVGEDNAIVRFDRDTATGALTGQGCIAQTPDLIGCGSQTDGLQTGRGVAVSADSKSVYVGSFGRSAVTRFDRETPPSGGGGGGGGGTDPPGTDPPSSAVDLKTRNTSCKGTCKKVKVKVELPPGPTGGRVATCNNVVGARFCPGWSARRAVATGQRAKSKNLVKTKFVDVTMGGTVTIPLKTTKAARKTLAKKDKLTLKLQVDFEPVGGARTSDEANVKVKRKD